MKFFHKNEPAPIIDDTDYEADENEEIQQKPHYVLVNNKLFDVTDDEIERVAQEKAEIEETIENNNSAILGLSILRYITYGIAGGAGAVSAVNLASDLLNGSSILLNSIMLGAAAVLAAGGYVYTNNKQSYCNFYNTRSFMELAQKENEYNEMLQAHTTKIEERENGHDHSYM